MDHLGGVSFFFNVFFLLWPRSASRFRDTSPVMLLFFATGRRDLLFGGGPKAGLARQVFSKAVDFFFPMSN